LRLALTSDSNVDYDGAIPMRDLLDIAADAATRLESHGLVACGRRVNGVTRVDFWTRAGQAYSLVLDDSATSVDDVLAKCLETAGVNAKAKARSSSTLN
jgi:hypothetical protein